MNKPTNPKDTVAIGKVSMSVLPANVMLEVATAMFEGASKYGRHNYRHAGVRASVYYDATMRHLIAWWEGEDIDDASNLSHITKAISSLVVLRDAMLNDLVTDDRPPRPKVQIGKHIEALNDLCADLIERHKDADVTHYTEVALDEPGEPRAANRARRTRDQIKQDAIDRTRCSACGVPEGEMHRPNCEVLIHAHELMQQYKQRMEPTNPEAWDAGEKRMDNIARSHGDGEHYDEATPDPIAQPPDMSDPKNWEPGDVLLYVGPDTVLYTHGKLYPVLAPTKGDRSISYWYVADDDGRPGDIPHPWSIPGLKSNFKWDRRPSEELQR